MPEIIVATTNEGKMREIRSMCADIAVDLKSLRDIWPQPPVIAETGVTFQENAALKAAWVFERKNTWTLADDSGLEVDALDGEPGVFSSRYAGEEQNDALNIRKLLAALKKVPVQNRTARFRCVMVLKGVGIEDKVVEGSCEGTIVDAPRGVDGFGYDPVFVPRGYTHTFAEMSQLQKNALSHRARALLALKEVLYGQFGKM